MSRIEQTINRLPRSHHETWRFDDKKGRIVGSPWSGRLLAKLARALAPDAAETRCTLLGLREDFGLARGHLAAFMAVSEGTVKTWERGTRSPSLLARRLIWFLDNLLRDKPLPDMSALVRWESVAGESVKKDGKADAA